MTIPPPAPEQIQEVELKYKVIDNSQLPILLNAPSLGEYRVGTFCSRRIVDAYFDSADWALAQAGYALRFRQSDGTAVVQLKSLTPPQGGIHRRLEISVPTSNPIQPESWPEGRARELALTSLRDQRLQLLFYVIQIRKQAPLRLAGVAIAELSIDHVTWQMDGRSDTNWIVEVELKPGQDPSHLTRLQHILDAYSFLQMTAQSKYERGLALIQRSPQL
ncbi:MAG: CYTH domain-containing protein [Chloroflexi bacterium]|nr:CYTH domain-containing protein [Chloroflexota bacterium]